MINSPIQPGSAEMKPSEVYEYRNGYLGNAVICDAERSWVERYLTLQDFNVSLGGYLLSFDDEAGKAYLGVWGRRNAQRFRRILRELGAQIAIVRVDRPRRRVGVAAMFNRSAHDKLSASRQIPIVNE